VGDVRHDAVINIIEDVVCGQRWRGLSDFNEKYWHLTYDSCINPRTNNSVIDGDGALSRQGPTFSFYGGQRDSHNHLIAIANKSTQTSGVQIT